MAEEGFDWKLHGTPLPTRLPCGNAVLDELLDGGFEQDAITTIYGPAGSGKTNFCLLCIAALPKDKKVIYIDTEGSFSMARLAQIAGPNLSDVLSRLVFLNPTSFQEQKRAFERLPPLINDMIGLIILDSVAMLYRLEMGRHGDIQNTNKELGVQLGYLSEIARKQRIPIIITNQVYSDFEDKNRVNMVGGDLLKYQSKCLVELQRFLTKRRAILRKHRSLPDGREIFFKITQSGVEKDSS
jgi:DNA repair protein RadB